MAREMTSKAQEAIASALQAASAAGNPQVEPVHLLEALIEQQGGIALALLKAVGADSRAIGAQTRRALVALPSTQGASAGSAQPSRSLLAVVQDAGERADKGADQYVSTEHLLIALAASDTEAGRILKPGAPLVIVFNQMDVTVKWVHRLSRIMRSGDVHRADRPPRPAGFAPPVLERFWWEDRMAPEQILELGTTRSSYLRADAARRRAMQDNLRWYLYEHLGHRADQEITIPYSTLVWTTRAPAARVHSGSAPAPQVP